MKTFLAKIGFDKHHKFERFGITFGSLFLVLIIITLVAFAGKVKADNSRLLNKTIYTTEFTTSKTDIKGTVENIYRSKDKTKLFILLDISDVTNISVKADNYQMFLTGCSTTGNSVKSASLEHEAVNGSIYMFGATGYMGIYLVDSLSFPSQLYDLVVRCNSQIVSSAKTLTEKNDENMSSFDLYDQFRLYFNPGGEECTSADFLNNDNWTIVDAYEECVTRTQEKQMRDTLTQDITEMQSNLAAIDEYTSRLQALNVLVPDKPVAIKGDKVVTDETDGHLIFEPEYVLAGGFDFDWYNGSIKDGYLDKLCGDKSYIEYMRDKNTEVDDARFDANSNSWTLVDGTKISDLDTFVDANVTITTTVNLLTSAWNTYYNNKKEYECTDLKQLLNLELNARNIEVNYSVNSDKDALIVF